jgi:hypothetical protein
MSRETTQILLAALAALFVLAGCAERRSPTSAEIKTHPTEWTHVGSVDFHGAKVRRDAIGFCQSCHGEDAHGGTSEVSCYSACHEGGPGGHPSSDVWLDSDAERFHGRSVEETGPVPCQDCHGKGDSSTAYRGGWAEVSCYTCHNGPSGHPGGWLNPQSPEFHGTVVHTVPGAAQTCPNCHGSDLSGGTSGVACSTCHPPQ